MENKGINTEKAILEAALVEFADKGLTGSRTTEIAQRAGVTHTMLHYYFRTKELLFDNVVNMKITELCSSVLPAFVDDSLPLIQRIRNAVSLHFDFLKDNPKLPSLLIGIYTSHSEMISKITDKMREVMMPAVMTLQLELDKAYDAGTIDKVDAVMLLSDIISLNVMLFVLWPVISRVLDIDNSAMSTFLSHKKEENINTIIKRLQP